jgi:hypothetical protein
MQLQMSLYLSRLFSFQNIEKYKKTLELLH